MPVAEHLVYGFWAYSRKILCFIGNYEFSIRIFIILADLVQVQAHNFAFFSQGKVFLMKIINTIYFNFNLATELKPTCWFRPAHPSANQDHNRNSELILV